MARPSWHDFLDRLQRDAVIRRVDPRTLHAIETLLDAGWAHAPEELAVALASLLAHDPRQWQQIQSRVRGFLAAPDPFVAGDAPPSLPAPLPASAAASLIAPLPGPVHQAIARRVDRIARSPSRALGWIVMGSLATGVLALAIGAVSLLRAVDVAIETPVPADSPAEPPVPSDIPQIPAHTPVPSDIPASAPTQPTPTVPRAPPPSPGFTVALMLCSCALVVLGLRWILAPRAQRRRAMDLHARASIGAQGPRVIYNVPVHPPFAVVAIDAAATLLARLPRLGRGRNLDVDATLQATVRAGGRTTPVLAATRASQELTILVDLERGDHPARAGVEHVLARWDQGGLRFVRLDFEHHPTVLRTHPDRRETNLDALGRRTEGTPLILFARATQLREYSGGHGWLRRLGPWPVRAIVDLDPRSDDDPALLREEVEARRALARAGLRRFPWTAAGLAAMAAYVGNGGVLQAPIPDDRLRPAAEIADTLDRWASCLACVPDPSWAQLEVFRREFFAFELPDPRYVQRLLDWVAPALEGPVPDDPITADGTRINLPRAKIQVHRQRLLQGDPLGQWRDLEARATAVILQQLRGAEPRAEADRRLRDLKVAEHEAMLAERDPRSPGGPTGLELFVGDTMEAELEHWVDEEIARHARANLPAPPWLLRLRRMIGRADLQIAHLGQWLVPRSLSNIAAPALLISGANWLAWYASSGRGDVPVLAAIAGLCGLGMAFATGRLLARRRRTRVVAEPTLRSPTTPALVDTIDEPTDEPLPATTDPADGQFTVLPVDEFDMPIVVAVPNTPPPPPSAETLGVVEVALRDAAPMQFIGLSGGEFTMGSPDDEPGSDANEHPRQRVGVKPFAIAEHPVTRLQWQTIMGKDPYHGVGDELPITGITWFEALEFLNRLSRAEDLRPCYESISENAWIWDRGADGYRLPTEAEWECAARAGTTTPYSFGADTDELIGHAWFTDNSRRTLHPVGVLRPNAWGLFDMHGLVWEWTWDATERLGGSRRFDPSDLALAGERVVRGGSFSDDPVNLRAACRKMCHSHKPLPNLGLRCARTLLAWQ